MNIRTILASSSPRRLELLSLINICPEVKHPEIEEKVLKDELPEKFVSRMAIEKGEYIHSMDYFNDLIVSADTVVISGEKIIGKPEGRADAFRMLSLLSGKFHKVLTGVSLIYRDEIISRNSVTEVKFSEINKNEINYYLDNEVYMDKAGAYAIQGKASVFVEKIDGCYFNVMGFPLNLFYSMIKELGISIEDLFCENISEGNVSLL